MTQIPDVAKEQGSEASSAFPFLGAQWSQTIFSKKSRRFSRWPFFFASAFLIAAWGWYGFAVAHWHGRAAWAVARLFPIPAAAVNGSVISYADVWQLAKIMAWSGGPLGEVEHFFHPALESWIAQKALAQLADSLNVSVEKGEWDEARRALEQQGFNAAGEGKFFSVFLKEDVGVSSRFFDKAVVTPWVLARKTEMLILSDSTWQEDRRLRAEEAWQRLQNGETFSDVAAGFSDHPSGTQGGDRGSFTRQTTPEGWGLIWRLQEREISPVVETSEGWVILNVAWITATEPEERRVRTIVVKKKTLDQVLDAYLAQSRIVRFLRFPSSTSNL